MIHLENSVFVPPIYLSVLLIIIFMMLELGSKKIKKALLPLAIALVTIFCIIAIRSIIITYQRLG